MKYFHLSSTGLAPGSIIEPGNWGRIVQHFGANHPRCTTEAIMEDVRANEFPNQPSRLSSSFFFDAIGEARFYRNFDNRSAMILYEVELLEPLAVKHATDWRNTGHDGSLTLDWARRYWRGELLPAHESGHICREVFAETPLKIILKLAF